MTLGTTFSNQALQTTSWLGDRPDEWQSGERTNAHLFSASAGAANAAHTSSSLLLGVRRADQKTRAASVDAPNGSDRLRRVA